MIEKLYQHYLKHSTICIDTRKIVTNCIFFALKGPNFDANKFAMNALKDGASLCVVDDPEVALNNSYFLVDDVLTTLQDLAKHHRKMLTIPIIGLTGSNGKTTSKELLATALRPKFNVFATQGNLNNHIGVPLSILSIKDEHEIAVIEMGANHVGEISFLCSIANPTHGFITNIGKAHLEGFGGMEGVIRGKSELYHHLIQHEGVVWINSNNEILSNMAKRFKNPLFYPNHSDYYHCEFVSANPEVKFRAENNKEYTSHLVGSYNFENIASALCIAKYFEVNEDDANNAVANYIPENNRSQVISRGTNTIILDAYNANPTSMEKALENLSLMNAQNKVAILGDMKELGLESDKEHEKLGEILIEKGIKKVILCGDLIKPALRKFPKADYYNSREELIKALMKEKIENSTILIKASRSIGLEKILEVL